MKCRYGSPRLRILQPDVRAEAINQQDHIIADHPWGIFEDAGEAAKQILRTKIVPYNLLIINGQKSAPNKLMKIKGD